MREIPQKDNRTAAVADIIYVYLLLEWMSRNFRKRKGVPRRSGSGKGPKCSDLAITA
jgi:hypothetical protein